MNGDGDILLRVDDLSVSFRTDQGTANVVQGVSFTIRRGEILGLVGESGSGKSVTALVVMGLLPQAIARVSSGRVLFDGQDLLTLPERAMRKLRGPRIGMIFQEPLTALNPVFTIGSQIMAGIAPTSRCQSRRLTRAPFSCCTGWASLSQPGEWKPTHSS